MSSPAANFLRRCVRWRRSAARSALAPGRANCWPACWLTTPSFRSVQRPGAFDCRCRRCCSAIAQRTLAGRIITEISVAVEAPPHRLAQDARRRTHRSSRLLAGALRDGRVRLAMTGVADVPVVVDDLERLQPPGDFRGSSEYRRALAIALSARVRAELGA